MSKSKSLEQDAGLEAIQTIGLADRSTGLGQEDCAPIALFVYARVDHLRQTVESLLLNPQCSSTRLYVFCDGPKTPDVSERTDAVRAYVDQVQGFAAVTRIYRDENMGLANSIISGVSEVVARHDLAIVMEDDLVVSPHFLSYMNQGLQLYRDERQVASIHGYSYPVEEELPDTFFLRGADCWGWATWARAWQHFEADGQKLLDQLKEKGLTGEFDFDGAYSYSGMLKNQIKGRNNSWAVRWHAACFLRNWLTLYPGKSLVNNIGNDGSGTHSAPTAAFDQTTSDQPVVLQPIAIEESAAARNVYVAYFKAQHSLVQRVRRKLHTLFNRV